MLVQPVSGGGARGGDDLGEFGTGEEAGGSAIACEGEAEFLVGNELLEGWFAFGFFVVVRAEVVRKPSEAIHRAEFAMEGICAAPPEPGVGTGGSSGDGDALLPGLVEDFVQAPFPPEDEHVVGRASADIDEILAENEVGKVAGRGAEEFASCRLAGELFGGFLEPSDAEEGVSGGGGDETEFGVLFRCESEDVAVEGGSVGLFGIESASADGEDGHGWGFTWAWRVGSYVVV